MAWVDYNDLIQFPYAPNESPSQSISDTSKANIRAIQIAGPDREVYSLQYHVTNDATYHLMLGEFEAVGYTRSFAWTPIGGSSANYRFTRFDVRQPNQTVFDISVEIERFNGE